MTSIKTSVKTAAGAAVSAFEGKAGDMVGKAIAELGGKNLELEVASGDALDVKQFSVQERMSSLFQVNLVAMSKNPSIEFDAVVGQPARFALHARGHDRFWMGLCNHIEQLRVEPDGESTYQLTIVPTLWLLSQRKNYRMFQQISEPDIVLAILEEWDIELDVRIDKGAYKKRKYRVQYAESDFAFISRMLEDAGISYSFEQVEGETKLVLADAPHSNPPRAESLPFVDDPNAVKYEYVTGMRVGQRVRPGKYTMRDHDYRLKPDYKLMSSASGGQGIEEKLERFQYTPGAFLFGSDKGEATPVADDRGKTRSDEGEAAVLAKKRLDAKRGSAKVVSFETNAHDLFPGMVVRFANHPRADLGEENTFLVVESALNGTSRGEWTQYCEARGTKIPFRPALVTPKPKVVGVESATVVGPAGEEIHTDEFGRVRVHFHWDRESSMDEKSSCWIHVSQPWGGAGYGGVNLPRIGQEVLVDFLGGDPDRPVVVGRVFTNLQKVPFKLPENKTQSGWKSNSTGGGGGYNEIMFEDAAGKELVRIQAEKDLNKLVKHDEQVTIGNNRTKLVKANDSLTVGGNRTHRVQLNEQISVGMNQRVSVGLNRATQVGTIDSTMVGDTHVITIAPPGEWSGGASTAVLMKDKKIVLDTGAGASISMEGAKIKIIADTICLWGKNAINVTSTGNVNVGGVKGLTLGSVAGDVIISGGPMVKINDE